MNQDFALQATITCRQTSNLIRWQIEYRLFELLLHFVQSTASPNWSIYINGHYLTPEKDSLKERMSAGENFLQQKPQ
jgi:hypothetical protein